MICDRCGDSGTLNTADGKEFYYCRTCKDEIFLADPTPDWGLQPDWDDNYSDGYMDYNPFVIMLKTTPALLTAIDKETNNIQAAFTYSFSTFILK